MNSAVLTRAQGGDSTAQAVVLREIGPSVAALIRRLGARGEDEDQLHDVFAHVLSVLPRFAPTGPATFRRGSSPAGF